jgi:lipoprotein-releasing system permease protein
LLKAGPVARELAGTLGGDYRVRDWTQQHANLFAAVKTERFTMFLILSLIVGVAAFNLVSTLVMVVTDKQADIAILRTLGMSPAGILKIFVVQGSTIGVVGTLAGVALGLLVAFNVRTLVPLLERLFGFEAMPGDIYYINFLPSEVRWPDVWSIALISLAFSVLATLYPAWRASRTQPAEALRHE